MVRRAKQMAIIPILIIAVAAFGVLFVVTDQEMNRSIHVKGVFVLFDEKELLNRIMSLSAEEHDRQRFIDEVYNMLNSEPYVASSSIRYSWPNEVEISITEINPLAVVNQSALLLGDCRIVSGSQISSPASLVNIEIDEKSIDEKKCQELMNILPVIRKIPVINLSVLVNDDYILETGGGQLVAGYKNIIEDQEKVRKLAVMIHTGKLDAEYVDMRYISGVAIRKVAKL